MAIVDAAARCGGGSAIGAARARRRTRRPGRRVTEGGKPSLPPKGDDEPRVRHRVSRRAGNTSRQFAKSRLDLIWGSRRRRRGKSRQRRWHQRLRTPRLHAHAQRPCGFAVKVGGKTVAAYSTSGRGRCTHDAGVGRSGWRWEATGQRRPTFTVTRESPWDDVGSRELVVDLTPRGSGADGCGVAPGADSAQLTCTDRTRTAPRSRSGRDH